MSTTTTSNLDADARLRLLALVERAATVLPVLWPLETFIAINPLSGFEHLPFDEALRRGEELFGAPGHLSEETYRARYEAGLIDPGALGQVVRHHAGALGEEVVGRRSDGSPITGGDLLMADLLQGTPAPPALRLTLTPSALVDQQTGSEYAARIDAEVARATARFLTQDSITWSVPASADGLYSSWHATARYDRSLPARARRALSEAPDDARAALHLALGSTLQDDDILVRLLEAQLASLPGWTSYLHGRGSQLLIEFLALRMTLEGALLHSGGVGLDAWMPSPESTQAPSGATSPDAARLTAALAACGSASPELHTSNAEQVLATVAPSGRPALWLDAAERTYRSALLAKIAGNDAQDADRKAEAAVVLCIDPRSEGLRRHLEVDPTVETYGFAGFFAVAMAFRDLGGGDAAPQCPVLLEPRVSIDERPGTSGVEVAARAVAGRRLLAGAQDGFHAAKDDALGPFALAETAGWIAGPLALARTLAPTTLQRWHEKLTSALVPETTTELVAEPWMHFDEQVLSAEVLCATTGVHATSARLVLLCGHGSTTTNNPYASALDCGACGGHRGAPNARIAAAIINRPDVRTALAERGYVIGADTWFVAGEHDTTTDEVALLDLHLVPESHRADVHALRTRLDRAGAALTDERAASLPGSVKGSARSRFGRSADWSQVLPEWGLAGNAAFIVGPRTMTEGLDLARRTFLHSYNPATDANGDALETILTAPMVVAQWINCQYYFSTVAPEVFGAGTKTIHNVVQGGLGVLSGTDSDLRLGLPAQSVRWDGQLVHDPLRLLTVVQAPLERLDDVIGRNQILRRLFGNGWVALAARPDATEPWSMRTPSGSWEPWPS